eukprot:Pgem_evm1s12892
MPGEEKQYDVVIYGATGFTGKLVAEYYLERYLGDYKFAIAGRNEKKLEEVSSFSMYNTFKTRLCITLTNEF